MQFVEAFQGFALCHFPLMLGVLFAIPGCVAQSLRRFFTKSNVSDRHNSLGCFGICILKQALSPCRNSADSSFAIY